MGTTGTVMIKILVFLILLLVFLWGLNIYKHIRSGWNNTQKLFDIIGAVLLLVLLAVTTFPLITN